MNNAESRRNFLKKAAYAAPAVVALGGLSAQAHSHGSSLGNTRSTANNGFGDGDQTAPGNSGSNNGAENKTGAKGKKK